MINATDFYSEEAYYEALDEEAGDGYRNEAQRVFANSRLTVDRPNDRAKIDALVADGRFVVAIHFAVYCPHTDAILGEATRIVSDHATRAEAISAYAPLIDDEPDPDVHYALYPVVRPAAPVAMPRSVVDVAEGEPWDIPF